MSEGSNGRISVSEDKLRSMFYEFKLELLAELKNYATTASVDALDGRVKVLEFWQQNILGQTQTRAMISARALAWAALMAACLGTVATLLWLHSG